MNIAVSDQVYLSELGPADRAACLRYLNDRYLYDQTLRIPYPYTDADFDRWLNVASAHAQQVGRTVHWGIRTRNGALIGGCGLTPAEGQAHRAEVGYWLGAPFRGRGIMTDVVRRLCALGFDDLGLVKIVAHVFSGNPASARVLEKCGFVQEGFLRKHFCKDGRYLDAFLFALIKES
jgi:RimJ/RimL family protein N-acetyltransferase